MKQLEQKQSDQEQLMRLKSIEAQLHNIQSDIDDMSHNILNAYKQEYGYNGNILKQYLENIRDITHNSYLQSRKYLALAIHRNNIKELIKIAGESEDLLDISSAHLLQAFCTLQINHNRKSAYHADKSYAISSISETSAKILMSAHKHILDCIIKNGGFEFKKEDKKSINRKLLIFFTIFHTTPEDIRNLDISYLFQLTNPFTEQLSLFPRDTVKVKNKLSKHGVEDTFHRHFKQSVFLTIIANGYYDLALPIINHKNFNPIEALSTLPEKVPNDVPSISPFTILFLKGMKRKTSGTDFETYKNKEYQESITSSKVAKKILEKCKTLDYYGLKECIFQKDASISTLDACMLKGEFKYYENISRGLFLKAKNIEDTNSKGEALREVKKHLEDSFQYFEDKIAGKTYEKIENTALDMISYPSHPKIFFMKTMEKELWHKNKDRFAPHMNSIIKSCTEELEKLGAEETKIKEEAEQKPTANQEHITGKESEKRESEKLCSTAVSKASCGKVQSDKATDLIGQTPN